MDNIKFIERCIGLVRDAWYGGYGENIDVFVVWSCKTLQNNKSILATIVDGITYLYEFTYNGDKRIIYMDAYSKDYHQEFQQEDKYWIFLQQVNQHI